MANQSTRVTILGDEYPVKGNVDDVTTHRVVEYLNQKIDEVRGKSATFDKLKVAILSALNIVGELFEYRSRNETVEQQLTALEHRAEKLVARIDGVL
jgi:cell division protein ZapA (FtsZ GTPase activity inhibitor)